MAVDFVHYLGCSLFGTVLGFVLSSGFRYGLANDELNLDL
jgi:hypothetical protein